MNSQQLWLDTLCILPEVIVTIVALLVFIWDFLSFRKSPHASLAAISLLGVMTAIMFAAPQWGKQLTLFSGLMAVDNFAVCVKILCLAVTAFIILISIPYLKKTEIARGEYYCLLLFATLGMMLVGDAVNMVVVYLGLELLALSAYILTAFMVKDLRSGEAAMKYFLLGSLASAIMVYGMSIIYGITGHLDIYQIQAYIINHSIKSDPALLTGLVLVIAGLGFKIGAVPFHMWLPDVYEGAPTPVTAFMATGSKVAPMAVLLRFLPVSVSFLSEYWTPLLAILAVMTMTVGNFLALRQDSLKRMFAYSGITHIGYALMGLVAAGVSREIGLTSVIFYFIVYMLSNVGAFGVLVFICKEDGRWGENYSDLKGLGKVSPLAAMVMSVFVMSMLGMPPTGGFMGKIWLFAAAVKTDMMWLAVAGVINAIISAYYYLRVMVMMYMHEPGSELTVEKIISNKVLALALLVMAAITVYMGINPGVFFDIAHHSLRTLI